MILKLVLVAVVLIGLAFAGFAIKMFFDRNAQFRKSCSSMDPETGERVDCTCGQGGSGESCENRKTTS
jgi:hypothetical protein